MKSRLPLLFLLSLLPAGRIPATAAEPWFCTTPGRTLVYERIRASDGRPERSITMQITAVRETGPGRAVDYLFTMRSPGGAALYGGTVPMTAEIDRDGGVRMDMGAAFSAVLHKMFPRAEQCVTGEAALLPAGMKPGDRLPDAHCVTKTGVVSHTVDVTEREVLRFERIRVPAGEFDCVVLREHKVERGAGRNRDTVSENWYARGVGLVRHDSYRYNNNGKLIPEASEVLKKY